MIIREVRWSDTEYLKKMYRVAETNPKNLEEFFDKYYTTIGECKRVSTGFPDTILIAEVDNKIIGCLHFYENCYEANEKVLLNIVLHPDFSFEAKKMLKNLLQKNICFGENWNINYCKNVWISAIHPFFI